MVTKVRRVKCIGLGGIGVVVAQGVAQFLASQGAGAPLWLIDGDKYEERNRDRVLFEACENKAVAKARELMRACARGVDVLPVAELVTSQNVGRLIEEGDVVFCCVDNHASRRLVGRRCQRLRDVVLISGGNDGIEAGQSGTFGNVQVYLRRAGRDVTNPITRFHPEIRQAREQGLDELGCGEQALAAPQLLFTNLAVAAAMLGAFYAWLSGTLEYEELYLDTAAGRMTPVKRALPRPPWRRTSGGTARGAPRRRAARRVRHEDGLARIIRG
jgi:hypothetical protein